MDSAVAIAKRYFELSNARNFDAISELFTDTTTYSSQNTGVYVGADQIMEMQRQFFDTFIEIRWDIENVEELRPGVVFFDFVLCGVLKSGERVHKPGGEYVVVKNGKIQHVEVRNK